MTGMECFKKIKQGGFVTMKKRVLALLLSACMVLGMAGCSSGKAETASDGGGGKASESVCKGD